MPKKRKQLKKETMDAIKCGTTKQAYTIFKEILDYKEYELKSQGLAAA